MCPLHSGGVLGIELLTTGARQTDHFKIPIQQQEKCLAAWRNELVTYFLYFFKNRKTLSSKAPLRCVV